MPSSSKSGSDRAGTPSSEAGTANSGLPVEERPFGAPPGAALATKVGSALGLVRCRGARGGDALCAEDEGVPSETQPATFPEARTARFLTDFEVEAGDPAAGAGAQAAL